MDQIERVKLTLIVEGAGTKTTIKYQAVDDLCFEKKASDFDTPNFRPPYMNFPQDMEHTISFRVMRGGNGISHTIDVEAIPEDEQTTAPTVNEQPKLQAYLGYATTEQLLGELQARIESDYFNGGGGLSYTTVDGRPNALAKH